MVQVLMNFPQSLLLRLDEAVGGSQERSRFVRLLLERRLAAPIVPEGSQPSIQVNIRIGAKELRRVQLAAMAAGMTRTEWIVSLIRRHHLGTPQLARRDRIALMEAHRELHRIGIVLTGLAPRRLMAGAPANPVDAELLAIIAKIERQMRGLRLAVEGNFEYWSVDP